VVPVQDARRSARVFRRRSAGPLRRSVATCSFGCTCQSRPHLRQHHAIRTERPRTVVSSTTDPMVAQETHLGGTVNRIVGSAMGPFIRDDTSPCRPFAVRKITYGFRSLSRSILRMQVSDVLTPLVAMRGAPFQVIGCLAEGHRVEPTLIPPIRRTGPAMGFHPPHERARPLSVA
jgi:hypothetical protein